MYNLAQRALLSHNCRTGLRYLSSGAKSTPTPTRLTTLDIDPHTSIATLTLNRLPANALSLQLMQDVRTSVKEIERSGCRGLILTSASSRIYCAGLDLTEVYDKPDTKHLTEFWLALQNMWQTLFSTSVPTAALVNGHATAGGCLLAISCDYRVMLPNFLIGMNETKASIAVPKWVSDTYANVLSNKRIAESDLIEGKLYDSKDALEVGLLDELVPSKEAGIESCLKFFESFKHTPKAARAMTKKQFRSGILDDFDKTREEDVQQFLDCIRRPEVQQFLGNYLQELKARKKKKTQ